MLYNIWKDEPCGDVAELQKLNSDGSAFVLKKMLDMHFSASDMSKSVFLNKAKLTLANVI